MSVVDLVANRQTGRGARAIVRELKHAIENGIYLNGDQLPPERELSEIYDASRSTIRRALEDLETDGMVTRRVGSGTFVSFDEALEPDLDVVVGQISPLQLIDARIGFERQMTRLAIAHATPSAIEAMNDVLVQMEQCEQNKDKFTQLDGDFHLMLARASGNPLIVQLYKLINEVRSHPQWQAAREQVLAPSKIRAYNKHHRAIIDALRNRSVTDAIEALNAHMELARHDLLGTEDE